MELLDIIMPQITPARGCIGCMGLVTIVSGFAVGVSRGLSQKSGLEINDDIVHQVFLYGPSVASVILSLFSTMDYAQDSRAMDEISSAAPPGMSREQSEGFYLGCAVPLSPFIGGGIVGAFTYAGYIVGKNVL